LGEQLDENLERRLKVLTGADSVKDKQIEQLKREVQNLTEYASNLMAQKETRIKSLISESRSLKTQLELGQGRFRTVPLSDCERRTSKLDETLNCLLAFLAGYGTATGLNL
jgi:hypothetical protein